MFYLEEGIIMTINMKEENVLFLWRTQHILFMVIWRQTYGKGPFR